jgi:muramoyltetrapeptide carboxypeptidase LdcA involved in peptidoglycan recycling
MEKNVNIFEHVREDPAVNALVRALGGWGQVKIVDVIDLRIAENPDRATEQLTLTLVETKRWT